VARVLTASRAAVAEPREAAYLEVVGRLAAAYRARGEHFWVFRSRSAAGCYLEFRERQDGPVATAPNDPVGTLENELRQLVRYADDAWELWDEVKV
jgi:hypothetical protein